MCYQGISFRLTTKIQENEMHGDNYLFNDVVARLNK